MLLAAAYGEMNELPAAGNALRGLLAQKQDFVETTEEFLTKWFEPQAVAQITGGRR
jgi:hypothetical protein